MLTSCPKQGILGFCQNPKGSMEARYSVLQVVLLIAFLPFTVSFAYVALQYGPITG